MEHKPIIPEQAVAAPIAVTPAEREKLQTYCEFFELSLPHLLGEETPQVEKAQRMIQVFLSGLSDTELNIDNCRRTIKQFETNKPTWLKVLLKRDLIRSKPETLYQKVQYFADEYAVDGISFNDARDAFFNAPRFFTKPLTDIRNNVDVITARYVAQGLNRKKYLELFLLQPSILATGTELIIPKLDAIVKAEAEGIIRYPELRDGSYGALGDFCTKTIACHHSQHGYAHNRT